MTLYRDILDLPVALAEYEAELVKNESLRETVSQQLVCAFKGADLAQPGDGAVAVHARVRV